MFHVRSMIISFFNMHVLEITGHIIDIIAKNASNILQIRSFRLSLQAVTVNISVKL